MNAIHKAVKKQRTRAGNRSRRAGFTLLEVAIAIAVVVIGVLALFALISAGLNASGKAVADTQAAMFADSVFNGIKAVSLKASDEGKDANGNVAWRVFWQDFKNGDTNISVPGSELWKTEPNEPLAIYGNGGRGSRGGAYSSVHALRFESIPQHDSGEDDAEGDP